ncbi:cyclopropane-fatty-acyl-phospholipid synthase [Sphingomonas sp. H39-1-10]|uniref:SAM-dependent methyltransferase n=1 Tax=Sphingomonas TaxID=13687 RepID=UPI000883D2F3|nr:MULTISPECIES: cyclopropane-fatty-acyl-phospholipid synthase family protein [Sphingomonas]MDF0488585.1 cyclopropane-fatty-acyl-phospholipid synthase [Sphingomonas pollutisoli]SDA12046.1 cyclopropane-fatty-acyl-phospholipid synthase [Sphingomonas sp. NFR15]
MNAIAPASGRQHGATPSRRPSALDPVFGLFAGVFQKLLDRIDAGLAAGSIETVLPNGRVRRLGGRAEGPAASVTLASWRALLRLATRGSVGWYVAWSLGEWSSPDPVALFELFVLNRATLGNAGRASGMTRRLQRGWHRLRANSRRGARRNIEFHYDLGNDFYSLWLDPTMSYSSALFAEPISTAQSLEDAQRAKLAAILDRTATAPGDTILEIGCGWGSFIEVAARAGRSVHGITLSAEQKRAVEARAERLALTGVSVSLTDYRDVSGTYDAVASIEMVEAVGQAYWPDYLAAIARALKPGGRAALQYIAIDDAIFPSYAANVDFIQRYVFPGGMLISESRFRAIAAEHGLTWTDRRGFGLHYAETLRRWREAFDRVVSEGRLPERFDSDFIGLWRYYLMYCEGGFRGGGIDVAQVTLVKSVGVSTRSP